MYRGGSGSVWNGGSSGSVELVIRQGQQRPTCKPPWRRAPVYSDGQILTKK